MRNYSPGPWKKLVIGAETSGTLSTWSGLEVGDRKGLLPWSLGQRASQGRPKQGLSKAWSIGLDHVGLGLRAVLQGYDTEYKQE